MIPNADHCGAYFADRPAYVAKIETFFHRSLVQESQQGLFQGKPVLAGPDELLARLIMGRIEAQNLTLGKERPDVQ